MIFVAIGVVLLYITCIMPQPAFVSETTLLVVPHNMVIASNADRTLNDIVLIAQQSIVHNTNIVAYDANVKVTRVKDHNAIHIAVYGHTEKDVSHLEISALAGVRDSIARYYVFGDDLSIEIISKDMYAHKTTSAYFAPYVLMITISLGLIAGIFALFYMIDLVRDKKTYSDSLNAKKIFRTYHTNHRSEEVRDASLDDPVEYVAPIGEREEKTVQEVDVTTPVAQKKEVVHDIKYDNAAVKQARVPDGLSATPSNLPIVDLDVIGFTNEGNNVLATEDEVDSITEPTEEELKARLNELLNGKL